MTTSRTAGNKSRKSKHGKRSPTGRKTEVPSPAQFPRLMLRAFLITLGIAAGSILICSLIAYFLPDPAPMIRSLSYVALALTALLGGIVAGRIHKSAPAVCGTVNGLLLLAVILLLSLFFRSLASGYSAWLTALLHAAVPLLSFAGAVIGVRH